MFDVTSDDISRLNDIDLRELVARLCEAELTSRGLSPAYVTWGGNQTAADGGLDVRVELPPGTKVDGFIPCTSTGFQVKVPDMPRRDILEEMQANGAIRPVISELAAQGGAYVIVSAKGSTADTSLSNRKAAMREALSGVPNEDRLVTDFYDRTRLATWVRRHSGLVVWVRTKVGRALFGWQAFGPWSGASEGIDAEYLLDDKLKLHLGERRDAPERSVKEAIDEIRDQLAHPRKIVRLVGLSGVGKTRLVQALFDSRIGSRPLPPSLAVYTNLSDGPDPQPIGLASDLIANRIRAVLIVDNCPPDLHGRLAESCGGPNSTLSVVTIEYDVRDDQPEGTQVVTLDTSSPELIAMLVGRKYAHISQVDARTIADASGGNARIALALAMTLGQTDTISGLSNDELFQRLFKQRHDPDTALLIAAQACSLVYSFNCEDLAGQEAELPKLAALASQAPRETYGHVGELLRRDLVQGRGPWRAVLPHALANFLAARALDNIPYQEIDKHLIAGGTPRLARSFSRRLSYLHNHPRAVAVAQDWLAPDGRLGDIPTLSSTNLAMFENISPVSPEATLVALERADSHSQDATSKTWWRHRALLRSLAYDPLLFERCTRLLIRAATECTDTKEAKEATEAFASLFTLHLSGTHASIAARLSVVQQLLTSTARQFQAVGLKALDNMLQTTPVTSFHGFEFGARSRDYGYRPRSDAERTNWYRATLGLVERLALTEGILIPELRAMVAQNFRGLWATAQMHSDLERLTRGFVRVGFWREGWHACLETIRFERKEMPPDDATRLSALEAILKPVRLSDRVHALVLSQRSAWHDLVAIDSGDDSPAESDYRESVARGLGEAVAADDVAFTELLPSLLQGGSEAYSFGGGLALGSQDHVAIWNRLVKGLGQVDLGQRDVSVLRGFIAEVWVLKSDLAQGLLDSAMAQSDLHVFIPALHSSVMLDDRAAERLKTSLILQRTPVRMYQTLTIGRVTDRLSGKALRDLVLLIADQPDGWEVALSILYMRLFSDFSDRRKHEPELLETGRALLQNATFARDRQHNNHELAGVVRACLAGPDAGSQAAEIAQKLSHAVASFQISPYDNKDLLRALLKVQPSAVLDVLLAGPSSRPTHDVFQRLNDDSGNPMDAVTSDALIAWCAEDSEMRYPLAASIITFAFRPRSGASIEWSDHARALLSRAPDPVRVLETLVERFYPMSSNGSRATRIEENMLLLDRVEPLIPSDVTQCVTEAKSQLAQLVAAERQRETRRDREIDERFE